MGYEGINFRPPKVVRAEAARGLLFRKKFRKGGLTSQVAGKLGIGSGIVRASILSRGMNVSPRTVRRMKSYFARHAVDKRKDWSNPKNPSKGYIAWLLWGGDSGRVWANKIVREMNRRDGK